MAVVKAYIVPAMAIVFGLWWDTVTDDIGPGLVIALGSVALVAVGEWRNHKLRQQLTPQLSFVIGEDSPFERDKPTVTKINTNAGPLELPSGGGMTIHSVGVVNSGHESAGGVRVRLMKIDPPALQQYWNAPLHVANEPVEVDRCDVHHSVAPVVFFEVVAQNIDYATNKATALTVRFAGESLFGREIPLRDMYFFSLAIDGPKGVGAERFVLQVNENGRYEMRHAL
ncbi:MAG TPA: hypothetical protein VFD69_10625, partial [Vicinamibacterales bacterium]|nr:hypothetical protein [Vicinamibacterales bacterium]